MSGLPAGVRDPDAEEADAMPEPQEPAPQDPEQHTGSTLDSKPDSGAESDQDSLEDSGELGKEKVAEPAPDRVEPDVAATGPASSGPASSGPASSGPGRWLAAAILVVALAVLVSGLVAWWRAAHDDRTATAERRDAVVVAATQDIEAMNSLDYRNVDAGLKKWLAVTTGTLHDQLSQVGPKDRKLLADQKKVSTGKVVDAAVVDLDTSSATVIASVEVTVRDGDNTGAKPTVKRNRFTADLERTGGTWKLESLEQVAVNLQ